MTTPDSTAVRAAEKRLRSCAGDWRLFPYPTAHDDMKTLADAYLALTDPTPLTVDVLVGMGFVKDGYWFNRGIVRVGWTKRLVESWAWYELHLAL